MLDYHSDPLRDKTKKMEKKIQALMKTFMKTTWQKFAVGKSLRTTTRWATKKNLLQVCLIRILIIVH